MLPGIAPTGRKVEIPLVAIVQFSGDKLAHGHIYWDQASVLARIGVLRVAPARIGAAARASQYSSTTQGIADGRQGLRSHTQ